jgi:hypothetical protein
MIQVACRDKCRTDLAAFNDYKVVFITYKMLR